MISFKYWKKTDCDLGFKRPSYGLFTFVDFLLICDFRSIEYQSNEIDCNSFFFIKKLRFFCFFVFVLDFNVDYSKPMRPSLTVR